MAMAGRGQGRGDREGRGDTAGRAPGSARAADAASRSRDGQGDGRSRGGRTSRAAAQRAAASMAFGYNPDPKDPRSAKQSPAQTARDRQTGSRKASGEGSGSLMDVAPMVGAAVTFAMTGNPVLAISAYKGTKALREAAGEAPETIADLGRQVSRGQAAIEGVFGMQRGALTRAPTVDTPSRRDSGEGAAGAASRTPAFRLPARPPAQRPTPAVEEASIVGEASTPETKRSPASTPDGALNWLQRMRQEIKDSEARIARI